MWLIEFNKLNESVLDLGTLQWKSNWGTLVIHEKFQCWSNIYFNEIKRIVFVVIIIMNLTFCIGKINCVCEEMQKDLYIIFNNIT